MRIHSQYSREEGNLNAKCLEELEVRKRVSAKFLICEIFKRSVVKMCKDSALSQITGSQHRTYGLYRMVNSWTKWKVSRLLKTAELKSETYLKSTRLQVSSKILFTIEGIARDMKAEEQSEQHWCIHQKRLNVLNVVRSTMIMKQIFENKFFVTMNYVIIYIILTKVVQFSEAA